MYQISEQFKTAMKSNLIIPRLRGTIDGKAFTEADILQGSFRVCNQCVDITNISLGGVFVGELRFTLLPTIAAQRGGWVGKEIYCEYGLNFGGQDMFIPCPSGFYYIYSATWTADGLEVVAYDSMSKLDKIYSGEVSTGTAFNWLQFIAMKTGVKIGNTAEEIASMPNGMETLGLYSADDIPTYRDLLMYLSSALCGFVTCGRDGSIVIKSFSSNVVDTIDESIRFEGASFSDYVTKYTGLSIVNMETREVVYYGMSRDDGLTMKLGTNPFLQFGTETKKKEMREAVLNGLQNFQYTPYSVSVLGCCAYDLGDVIRFTGGIAGNVTGCIMSYTFGLNDYSFAGYGDNPALISAQSKLDKEISGLYNSQTSETAKITALTNVEDVGVADEWSEIGQVGFAVEKQQTLMFHGAVKLNLDKSGLVRFKYKLNNEDLDYIHEAYVTEPVDTVTLFLPFAVDPSTLYSFQIFVQSDDLTGTVEAVDFRGGLIGIGVKDSDWKGVIDFSDVFALRLGRDYTINFNDESVIVENQIPVPIASSDFFVLEVGRYYAIDFNDSVNVITETDVFEMITEDGRPLISENENPFITDGGENNG